MQKTYASIVGSTRGEISDVIGNTFRRLRSRGSPAPPTLNLRWASPNYVTVLDQRLRFARSRAPRHSISSRRDQLTSPPRSLTCCTPRSPVRSPSSCPCVVGLYNFLPRSPRRRRPDDVLPPARGCTPHVAKHSHVRPRLSARTFTLAGSG